MDNDQNQDDNIKIKDPISLDSLSEDTCLEIIKVIQDWVEEGRTQEEKTRARRTRDSTLRAAALTSSKTFDVFQRELVTNLNFSVMTIFSVHSMLEAHDSYGPLVKSIHLLCVAEQDRSRVGRRLLTYFEDMSSIDPDATMVKHMADGLKQMVEAIFNKLVNIQTMIVEDNKLFPSFKRTPFLVDSLRKLHVLLVKDPNDRLNASNVLWILAFCQFLKVATIGFVVRKEDYWFLKEHANHLVGISRVEKLSLEFDYAFDKSNRRTWWAANPGEPNQKTQSLIYLLSTLNKDLTCLELGLRISLMKEEDQVFPHLNCICTLQSSFKTMEHLRLLYLDMDPNGSSPCFSLFKNLKALTLDLLGLRSLLESESLNKEQLPSSTLETLVLPYYTFDPEEPIRDQLREEAHLLVILKSVVSLKLVAVPSKLIDSSSDAPKVPSALEKVWRDGRSALKADEAITSGRVELREVEVGEIAPVGEQFMSNLTWLSPL